MTKSKKHKGVEIRPDEIFHVSEDVKPETLEALGQMADAIKEAYPTPAHFRVAYENAMPIVDEWQKCYPSRWGDTIVTEAMEHPAKYSNKLIRRIYEHMITEGWLQRGDWVIDPFGGVALGALDAMQKGLNWIGNELEPRFHRIGAGYDCPGFTLWEAAWFIVANLPVFVWRAIVNRKPILKEKKMPVWMSRYWPAFPRPGVGHLCPACTNKTAASELPETSPHHYTGNLEKWQQEFGNPNWGSAVLLQGDSRRLLEIIQTGGAAGTRSSPPYGSTLRHRHNSSGIDYSKTERKGGSRVMESIHKGYGDTEGQLGHMRASVSSPPFLQAKGGTPEPKPGGVIDEALYRRHAAGNGAAEGYGGTDGQLANMPEGVRTAAMKSPPFSPAGNQPAKIPGKPQGVRTHYEGNNVIPSSNYGETDGQLQKMRQGSIEAVISSPPYNKPFSQEHNGRRGGQRATTPSEKGAFVNYGTSDGQIEGLPEGDLQAVISSPPYDETRVGSGSKAEYGVMEKRGRGDQYGEAGGQIAGRDDFWSAARTIVEQVFLALEPGGHAAWVVKDYVKDGQRVPFCENWRQLCESVGFVTLHEHRALFGEKTVQGTLEGGAHETIKEHKSFLRRVAEKKGSPRIDWETVYCMERPL